MTINEMAQLGFDYKVFDQLYCSGNHNEIMSVLEEFSMKQTDDSCFGHNSVEFSRSLEHEDGYHEYWCYTSNTNHHSFVI